MDAYATREQVVATIEKLHLSLASKCREEIGVDQEDSAIAAFQAALSIAIDYADGNREFGIMWLRCCLDLIEGGQVLTEDTIQ